MKGVHLHIQIKTYYQSFSRSLGASSLVYTDGIFQNFVSHTGTRTKNAAPISEIETNWIFGRIATCLNYDWMTLISEEFQ